MLIILIHNPTLAVVTGMQRQCLPSCWGARSKAIILAAEGATIFSVSESFQIHLSFMPLKDNNISIKLHKSGSEEAVSSFAAIIRATNVVFSNSLK